jgi:4a-hydroxytetrahydrobiopterin dehydratase
MGALSGTELSDAAGALQGWSVEAGEGAIVKGFRFESFVLAFAFMTAVALEAERTNHHPEWTNVYSRVDARLSSHDTGGVTERDLALARFMDAVAAGLTSPL